MIETNDFHDNLDQELSILELEDISSLSESEKQLIRQIREAITIPIWLFDLSPEGHAILQSLLDDQRTDDLEPFIVQSE